MSRSLTLHLPDDLASVPPDLAETLDAVRSLLADIRQRLDGEQRLAVDGRTAAKLCGCCERSLVNHGAPFVMVGGRRLYRVEALREWLASQERREAIAR